MPPKSPLLGYNNNIPHKGKMYHVQTEDSGTRRPHVITHLFADGGRIVHTTKTSYSELVDDPEMVDKVQRLMKDQHRAMVDALRKGELEHLLGAAPGPRISKPPPRLSKPPPPPARSSVPPGSKPPRASVPPLRASAPPPRNSKPPPASGVPSSRRSKAVQPPSDQPPPIQEIAGSGYRWVGQARKKTNPELELPRVAAQRAAEELLPETKRRGGAPAVEIPAAPALPDITPSFGSFGARTITDRPLDQVILAFLQRRG